MLPVSLLRASTYFLPVPKWRTPLCNSLFLLWPFSPSFPAWFDWQLVGQFEPGDQGGLAQSFLSPGDLPSDL